jgi:DNA-binding response OmpR family regulator
MPRALIVSEDQPALEGLRAALAAQGFDVLVAHNGADGVELAGRHELDGIVVDLDLAAGRGLEVCHRVSQQNRGLERNVPVWMITTPHGAETRRLVEVCGAAAVWRKPVDAPKLARRFENHLNLARLAAPALAGSLPPTR